MIIENWSKQPQCLKSDPKSAQALKDVCELKSAGAHGLQYDVVHAC